MGQNNDNFNRKFTRVEWISECTIDKKSISYKAKIINISATGFFIECSDCVMEMEEEVFVSIGVNENGIASVGGFQCKVVRTLKDGFAVHILESDFFLYNKLLSIISENSEDAHIIKKEIANAPEFVKMWKGIEINRFS